MAARKPARKKAYRIPAQRVEYVRMAGGIASDRITVDGLPVGRMERNPPLRAEDSGWSFFAGNETKRYMQTASNLAVWHVNDIANMDPSIVPWLYALPGARFERDHATGRFVEAPDSVPDPTYAGLPQGIRVVQGVVEAAPGWHVSLPTPFRRRVEDGSVVLWRPGLTFWIKLAEDVARPALPETAADVYEHSEDESGMRSIFRRAPPGATPFVAAYVETGAPERLLLHAYYDRVDDLPDAVAIARSLTPG